MKTGTERTHQGQQELPVKVGDKVSLKISCECIDVGKDFVCPFESDCEFDECSNGNERVITSTIKSIWNEGLGWFFSVEGLNIDIPMTDIGKSVMLVEAAGEKVKMSADEAKKFFLIEKECINRNCDRNCINCDIVQNVDDLNDVYNVGILALEKQASKKPVEVSELYGCVKCPVCQDETSINVFEFDDCYCVNCGQKLAWGEEK